MPQLKKNREYAKKKESVTHSQKKKQATETASERMNMLDLTEKNLQISLYEYAQRTKGKHALKL